MVHTFKFFLKYSYVFTFILKYSDELTFFSDKVNKKAPKKTQAVGGTRQI